MFLDHILTVESESEKSFNHKVTGIHNIERFNTLKIFILQILKLGLGKGNGRGKWAFVVNQGAVRLGLL